MPFVAFDAASNSRIDITKLQDPRDELTGADLRCQLCGAKMILHAGRIVRPHFKHKSVCTSNYDSHPESPEHLAGKTYISEIFCPSLGNTAQFQAEYEVPIPEVRRVADLLVGFPMGWQVAHEIQLSSITVKTLDERTADYLKAGIDVVWWLGASADTPANREWPYRKYGFVPHVDTTDKEKITVGYWYLEVYKSYDGRLNERMVLRKSATEGDEIYQDLVNKISWWWQDLAFYRYFQVWKKGKKELYQRGLLAGQGTIQSFGGRIGAGNGKYLNKVEDCWCIDWAAFLEQKKTRIEILSDSAVQLIRDRAREGKVKYGKIGKASVC